MKNTRLFLAVFLGFGLLLVAGCSKPKEEEVIPAASASVLAGNWLLIEPASAYTVTLEITDIKSVFNENYGVQLSGQSSVNQYSGTGSFSQRPSIESGPTGTGSVGVLASTKMGGPPAAMQFEDTYFARLRAVNFAGLVGTNRLHLRYGGTLPGVLVYKRQ